MITKYLLMVSCFMAHTLGLQAAAKDCCHKTSRALDGVAQCLGLVSKPDLSNAIMTQNDNEVGRCIVRGANVNWADCYGGLPLHDAIKTRNAVIVGMLLDAGANVEALSTLGRRTPLYAAVEGESFEIMQLLMNAHADVNAAGVARQVPLHAASRDHDTKCFQALLEAGANPRVQDIYGWTPLHMVAATGGNVAKVKALIAAGVDVNAVDISGNTALHLAALYKYADCIKALLKAGAVVDIKDQQEKTVVDTVAGHAKCMAALCLSSKKNV